MTTAQDESAATNESVRQRAGRLAETVPLPAGVLTGVGTTVAGYLTFFGVVLATGAVDFSRSTGDVLRSVANFFYNAHNVPTYQRQVVEIQEGDGTTGEIVREFWTNGITGWQRIHQEVRSGETVFEEATETTVVATDTTLPQEAYLVVPVLVLLTAGVLFALRFLETPAPGKETVLASLLAGGSIALGYLLVALVGTYVLVLEGSTDGTVLHPARLEALGYGVAYPLVVGTIGAALGVLWKRRTTGTAATTE